MSMQVHGVLVTAIVVEKQAVALALLDGEQGIGLRPGFSVDGPPIMPAASARDLLEFEADRFVGCRRRRAGAAEDRVIPFGIGGGRPCRIAASIGIFDDYAHAHVA